MESISCVFCRKKNVGRVNKFSVNILRRCQTLLKIRQENKLKYSDVVLPLNLSLTKGYHRQCYSNFTSVKQRYKKSLLSNEQAETSSASAMASPPRATICDLPDEVLVTIFSHLPVADLARCAATCERWRCIVTAFTVPWKGKTYRSCRSPAECAETRAVLHALPPLREVDIWSSDGFMMNISYPRIELTLKYVRVLQDFPKLRCKVLLTTLDTAGDILSNQSATEFEGLQQLEIMGTWKKYSADYVLRTALNLCTSLRHLSIYSVSVSEENLIVVEGLRRLKSLKFMFTRFQKLSFLRHFSEALEDLQLLSCTRLPSRELTELRQLRCLRSLRLSGYLLQEVDLVAAVVGLANLERLHLERCYSVRDLSFVQQCGRLTELRITNSLVTARLEMPEKQDLALAVLWQPTYAAYHNIQVVGVTVTAVDPPDALTQLGRLGLASGCLAYLGTLRNCSQLRHLVCDFVRLHELRGFSTVRINISLTSSAQP